MMDPVKLSNGHTIPPIGLGVWKVRERTECITAVSAALEAGYRHIDTAQAYGNEPYVGEAVVASGPSRSEIFITTKIRTENIALGAIAGSFKHSLAKLKTDYVDLLLLHFPVTLRRRPAWPKMEKILESGQAKSIGVSNYTIRHLEELLVTAKKPPAVNQVELHVYLQQPELLEFCKKHNIVVEAYSPLVHGQDHDNPVLTDIARKHNKTPAQIMIRWCIEQGAVPLPKSVHSERIKANLDVFDFSLDADDLAKIKTLDRNLHTAWDPTRVI